MTPAQLHNPPLTDARDRLVEDAIARITAFHGRYAPGVVIGAYMVDLAQELLPPLQGKMNAIAESRVCLADAIQIMTGCTLGNKYLWVKDHGRYALCLYDRETLTGIRVTVSYDAIDAQSTPVLKGFFDGSRTYENVPRPKQQQIAIREFLTVKRNILVASQVRVGNPAKPPLYPLVFCPACNEYFRPTPTLPQCLCQTEPSLYA